jgi:hypothetical protein
MNRIGSGIRLLHSFGLILSRSYLRSRAADKLWYTEAAFAAPQSFTCDKARSETENATCCTPNNE